MQKQLEVTPEKLEKIGFKKHIIPALKDCEDEWERLNTESIRYEIKCLNGCFFYNLNDATYRWYQQIKVGAGYNSIHLDIQHGPQLFTVLRAFRVDYNFYNI